MITYARACPVPGGSKIDSLRHQLPEPLSNQFARSGTDKFAGVRWTTRESGSPVLDGVCAWIDCTLTDEFDGGDHTIVVGRVHDLHADSRHLPLLFHRGRYGLAPAEDGA